MAQSTHCSISISQGHKAFSSQPFEVSSSLLSSLSPFRSHSPSPAVGPSLISELTTQTLTQFRSPLRLSILFSCRLSLAVSPSPVAVLARHLSPLFGEFDFTNIWGLLLLSFAVVLFVTPRIFPIRA
ncbi:hypothetical protein RIF29_00848 [Crotalaria pallida]|uniref:Uncharacterized protein n=1 Tax=Crotalaria pallida TaxID=3830 RepID=A0AAN9P7B9_CROPI